MAKSTTARIRQANQSQRTNLVDFPFENHLGIYRLSDKLSTPPDYFWTLQNCYVSRDNWIQQRDGFVKTTSTPISGGPKVRKLFETMNSTGGKTIISRGGTGWFRLTGTTWTSIDSGRTSDAHGQICQFNNTVLMCDGGDPRVSDMNWNVSGLGGNATAWLTGIPYALYDYVSNGGSNYRCLVAHTSGTFATDLAANKWKLLTCVPSHSSCVHVHNHRVVLNDDDNPMDVVVSKVDNPNFDTDITQDAIRISLNRVIPWGDKIMGYSTYLQTYLVIWMQKCIVIYNLPTTYSGIGLQQIIYNTGCLSYDGVYQVDSDLWFPHDSGYTSLSMVIGNPQVIDLNDVGRNIGPWWRNIIDTMGDTRDICGTFVHTLEHFYFCINNSGTYEIWVFSKDLEAITKGKGNVAGMYTGMNACSFLYTSDNVTYYGGDDGHLYQMNVGTNDNGSPTVMYVEKTGVNFGNSKIFKSPREFESLMQATSTLTATISYNYETAGLLAGSNIETVTIPAAASAWDTSPWDVSPWDSSGSSLFKTRNFIGRGKVMNFSITHNTIDAQLRIRNFIFSVGIQGDK